MAWWTVSLMIHPRLIDHIIERLYLVAFYGYVVDRLSSM
jgi:hypothetical protein